METEPFSDAMWMAACEKLNRALADFVVEGRGAGASDEDIRSQIDDVNHRGVGGIWEES